MKIFLAGIMRGSHRGAVLHEQDYRSRISRLLTEHLPGAVVYDPLAGHGNSIEYDDDTGREVFFRHNRMCRDVDAVVAFVPEASFELPPVTDAPRSRQITPQRMCSAVWVRINW